MPFDYRFEKESGIVRVTATKPVSAADVTGMLDRQLAEGTWRAPMLVDARLASLSTAESKVLFEYVQTLAVLHGPPGPVAVVTRDGVRSAQSYATRCGKAGLPFDVFWDFDEAEHWLGVK